MRLLEPPAGGRAVPQQSSYASLGFGLVPMPMRYGKRNAVVGCYCQADTRRGLVNS
jgi:hypothetical protein